MQVIFAALAEGPVGSLDAGHCHGLRHDPTPLLRAVHRRCCIKRAVEPPSSETARARLLEDSRSGRSRALFCRGEPGIEKTTLLEHPIVVASVPGRDVATEIAFATAEDADREPSCRLVLKKRPATARSEGITP